MSVRPHLESRPSGTEMAFARPAEPTSQRLSTENMWLAVHPVPDMQTLGHALPKNVEPFLASPCLTQQEASPSIRFFHGGWPLENYSRA